MFFINTFFIITKLDDSLGSSPWGLTYACRARHTLVLMALADRIPCNPPEVIYYRILRGVLDIFTAILSIL